MGNKVNKPLIIIGGATIFALGTYYFWIFKNLTLDQ